MGGASNTLALPLQMLLLPLLVVLAVAAVTGVAAGAAGVAAGPSTMSTMSLRLMPLIMLLHTLVPPEVLAAEGAAPVLPSRLCVNVAARALSVERERNEVRK